MNQILPYGSWPSTINASLLTQQSVRLGDPIVTDSVAYWLESRPSEKGRSVLMKKPAGAPELEVLPKHVSVRTRAHEYGGSAYAVCEGTVYFVDESDQRIYRWSHDHDLPEAITPEGHFHYADLTIDQIRSRLICVREDLTSDHSEVQSTIIAVPLNQPHEVDVLISGCDFYSNPALSPDGQQLSWLCWNHPNMPWDNSECWLSKLDSSGSPSQPILACGNGDESVFQPQWGPDNQLYLVSDRSNWWNLYRYDSGALTSVLTMEAEFATPQWVFGMSTYGFLSATEILACCTSNGQWQMLRINLQTGKSQKLDLPHVDMSQVRCSNGQAVFLGTEPTQAQSLNYLDLSNTGGTNAAPIPLRHSNQATLDPATVSNPESMQFPTANGEKAYGFFYAPSNPHYQAPANSLPPLIVLCHGGPTGATEAGLNLKTQYWTSRGFAVMDVNYRGSTGYGRQYRHRLSGRWGVSDVEDVCAAARHLVREGRVNPDQLIIKGSSAGGYTVLAALAFSDVFHAGCSLYGIGNLETLAQDTHKFESRYLDGLVGPYPQQQSIYHKRSPLLHPHGLNCPVIFFQGLKDKVVPPNQAEAMVAELEKKSVPVAYITFAEEGHGFKQAANIERSLEAEWSFYGQIFDFSISANIEPVTINNLQPSGS